jgi:hypothetical protein
MSWHIVKLLGVKRRLNAESSMLKAIKKEMMLKDQHFFYQNS